MTESSNTCDEHGSEDIRNCVGYAIQQIARHARRWRCLDRSGEGFRRGKNYILRFLYRSWHSGEDVNDSGAYQHSGFDVFFGSGLTNNLPAMIPVTNALRHAR